MNSFTGTITKKQLLAEIAKHRKADQIVQGVYGEGERLVVTTLYKPSEVIINGVIYEPSE